MNRKWLLMLLSFGVIALSFLLREHWGHILGFLPYVILLACPLMHLFHHHGGHHAGHEKEER